ncbi:hypothetical protein OPT61_g4369 [Boeremia exigua]|uniref:Uncharacterized protein n=1 Tax=Boeremia exigua TaxID=749465 RepID=A0ACC2IE79_9PLEO|nr:hypothetical protein OPT61_g4369 [Boeremia exigua]
MPLPTHAAVTRFVASLLPFKDNDVPLRYHVPRRRRYDAELAFIDRIVLSITPTPGVYGFIGHAEVYRPLRTLCFLHRPWQLDRRAVRGDTLVLSSHTSFDEHLTVGWNPPLAMRLGMAEEDWFCVKGYKGDAERKIGIVGSVSLPRHTLLDRIQSEFGQMELIQHGQSDKIRVVAIMNAFNEEEVLRVLNMAQERALVPDASFEAQGRHVLYLTGQPRESGMLAATTLGLTVACVGHRTTEEWGIRFLAAALRTAFPDLEYLADLVHIDDFGERKHWTHEGVYVVALTCASVQAAGARSAPTFDHDIVISVHITWVLADAMLSSDPKSIGSNEPMKALTGRHDIQHNLKPSPDSCKSRDMSPLSNLKTKLPDSAIPCAAELFVSISAKTLSILPILSENYVCDIEDQGSYTRLMKQ